MSDEKRPTIREACRRQMPLGGHDAQALEGALQQVERELATADTRITELTGALERAEALLREDRDVHGGGCSCMPAFLSRPAYKCWNCRRDAALARPSMGGGATPDTHVFACKKVTPESLSNECTAWCVCSTCGELRDHASHRKRLDPVEAILAVECPDCGMEKWPCFAVGDSKMVHLDRIRASRTTTRAR